jgi:hypothetical protein
MTEISIVWGKSEMHFPGWRSRGEVWRTEWKWKIYASVIITNTAWVCDVRRRGIWASDLSSGSEQLFAARAQAFLESETRKPSFRARPSTRRQKTHQKFAAVPGAEIAVVVPASREFQPKFWQRLCWRGNSSSSATCNWRKRMAGGHRRATHFAPSFFWEKQQVRFGKTPDAMRAPLLLSVSCLCLSPNLVAPRLFFTH